ncbi:hypothetical protein PT015_10685 [Candidatus Mycobacterium wuenschmannii]|uniref:PE-PGRS family protein n=1 Tax=Candidatus Mycobacterium wuenschmannii TaxID=3027808 RepID=A0ABY8W7V7_9MYCO|nr:hypothetical protein [Candidatus Mycobacterium wuenschmannii]WIM89844.1 hypothetical protein PT015_10685 [Candidatus Mycobacterium wuenschmannii]
MHSISRPTPALGGLTLAGIALAGAALAAIGQSAPTLSGVTPNLQQREVKLIDAASDFVLTDWGTVFTDAQANLTALQADIAAVPLQSDLETLFGGFSTELTADLQSSATAFQTFADSLPDTLQSVSTDLAAGKFTDAFVTLDTTGLNSLEDIGKPLFDLLNTTARGTGEITELGILGTLAQDATNAFNSVFTTGGAFELSKALLTPEITATFELANNFDAIEASFASGDYTEALAEIQNIPSGYIGALLNGFVPVVDGVPTTEAFPGLLDLNSGALEYFFVTIPTEIANSLGISATDTAASTLVDSASLIDPTSFADLVTSLFGSL